MRPSLPLRLLSLTETHEVELQHRTRKAWAKFGAFREELINKEIPLKLRLKLFDAVVTPTALYGCSSWARTEFTGNPDEDAEENHWKKKASRGGVWQRGDIRTVGKESHRRRKGKDGRIQNPGLEERCVRQEDSLEKAIGKVGS